MSDVASSAGPDQSIDRLVRQQLHLSLHHVTIMVRDQDRSLRFYRDQLGFNLVADVRLESGDRWVAVLLLMAPQSLDSLLRSPTLKNTSSLVGAVTSFL